MPLTLRSTPRPTLRVTLRSTLRSLASGLCLLAALAALTGDRLAHAQPAPTAGDVVAPAVRELPAWVTELEIGATPATAAAPRVWWQNVTARPNLTLQVAYTPYNAMPVDEAIDYPGGPARERNFQLRNTTIGFSGQLFFDWLTYVAALASETSLDGQLLFGLDVMFLRVSWLPESMRGKDYTARHGLTVGGMRIPFSRQSLMSEARLQLINRAIVVEEMDIRRDVGATLDAEYGLAREAVVIGLRGGVFNGRGDRVYLPDNNGGVMWVGRLRIDFFSRMFDSEGDDRPTWLTQAGIRNMLSLRGPQLSVGASVLHNDDISRSVTSWGIDGEFRWFGLAISGEYMQRDYEAKFGETILPDQLASQWANKGWFVQGGYYVLPEHIELAARYEAYSLELLNDTAGTREFRAISAGLNAQVRTPFGLFRYSLNYVHRIEEAGVPSLANDSVTMKTTYQF